MLRERQIAYFLVLFTMCFHCLGFSVVWADKPSEVAAAKAAKEAAKAADTAIVTPAISTVNTNSVIDSSVIDVPVASEVQSTRRAYSLDTVGNVMIGGSDTASSDFQNNQLPDIAIAVQQDLSEFQGVENAAAMATDPSQLKLVTDASVRVYFVTEGAGYHNALGFNTESQGVDDGDPLLIFPDASSSVSLLHQDDDPNRSSRMPLLPGDFVDLGTMTAGSQLDFFLIAQGMTGRPVYGTDETVNPDGIQHVVTLALEDSALLIMGFEDLWGGGDRDFNDLVIAIDIGKENVAHLSAAPEPATGIMFAIIVGLTYFKKEDEDCNQVV